MELTYRESQTLFYCTSNANPLYAKEGGKTLLAISQLQVTSIAN